MNAGTDELRDGLHARLVGLLLALVTAAVVALGAAAVTAFDRAVEPELGKRTRLIGTIVRGELQRVLDLGIGLDAVAGLDRYLSETIAKFSEVDRIVVSTASGRAIAAAERHRDVNLLERPALAATAGARQHDFVLPILDGNRVVGDIRVEISPLFVQTRLRDVFLDVLVIALVATLVALELALAVAAASVGRPLERVFRLLDEQRAGLFLHRIPRGGLGGLGRAAERLTDHAEDLAARMAALPAAARARIASALGTAVAVGRPSTLRLSGVNDVRLALFVFSVATEVSVSFLPVHARDLAKPGWLSAELAAAAPLLSYLCAMALLVRFAGAWARRVGPRRMFLLSTPPAALALLGMASSGTVLELTFWRGLTAVFYATATIACQEYAIRAGAGQPSTRPVGATLAVVFSGVFCGSALGGVIAGRFGIGAAFVAGALLAVVAGALGLASMRGAAGDPVPPATNPPPPAGSPGARKPPLVRWRYRALLLGVAVPMSATTAVFVWYLTPLMLSADGSGPAEIGRVVMLYYLAVVVTGPTVTRLSDGRIGPFPLVVAGVAASGIALLSLVAWSGYWAVVGAVAALGIAHTGMRAPLYALAQRIAGGAGGGLDGLRVAERVGAIAGLAASAILLRDVGPANGIAALGAVVLAGIALYALVDAASGRRY